MTTITNPETLSDLLSQIMDENPTASRADLQKLFLERARGDADLLDEAMRYAIDNPPPDVALTGDPETDAARLLDAIRAATREQ
jgi:hypothetical protein